MFSNPQHSQEVHALLQRVLGRPLQDLQLQHRPLIGGLEAPSVTRVTARYRCEAGVARRTAFVLKQMEGEAAREARLYTMLESAGGKSFAPRMLGVHEWSGRQFLFLEAIDPVRSWPWRDHGSTRQVMALLARLHLTARSCIDPAIHLWDYESSLRETAAMTVEALAALPKDPKLAPLRRQLPALRRLVASLPALRAQLLAWPGLGSTLIHGDVHPGNVMIRRRRGVEVPTLLDWARARIGSPLEDVSSWLQSLGYWEPEARRRHDTLFEDYLAARGFTEGMTPRVREAYWLAGGSNALSGALLYHLQIVAQEGLESSAALHAARDWLRIVRRADACWKAGGGLHSVPSLPS